MSCIHFRFKSSLEDEKVTFNGLQISLGDLKEAIMKQKKIGGANQYTLSVRDAQSKKVYEDDNEMLSRNTSVIISRVPLVNAPKIPKTQLQDPSLPQPASSSSVTAGITTTSLPALTSETQHGKLTIEELSKTPDLTSANATEEEKVLAMMNQSAEGYNPSQYVKFAPRRGGGSGGGGGGMVTKPPPPSYRCYRCGQPGHYINVCPTNGDPKFDNYRYKPVRGTPSNQVIQVPTNVPGAMLDRHGNLVVRAVDYQAYLNAQMKGKKTAATVEAPKEAEIPPELLCHLCKELVRDAVIIPCCGESFCYECIQDHLCENEFTCPMCKAADISPERLAPNKALRASAKNFQLKAAEQKSEAVARGFIKQAPLPSVVSTSTISTTQPSSTSVTPSQPSQNTAPTASTTSSSVSQSLESTVSTSSETTSSQTSSQTSSTENGPSNRNLAVTEEATPSAPATVDQTKKGVATTTTASLAATSLGTAKSGLVTQAKDKTVPNGLTGITAGSVPVVKTDPLTHFLNPHVLAPTAIHRTQMGGLLPHPIPLPQPVVKSSDNLERLAADLLLGTAKKSPSPPPLTAEEFYRQQKLLQLLTKKTGSRSNTPGSNSSVSGSVSNSRSRSRSRSWSYDSRSRSRSPHHKKKPKKSRSHRHSKRSERNQERSKHRSHHKRPRNDSRERKEEGSKRASKRHRSPSVSPERKRIKEDVSLSQGDRPLSQNRTPVCSGGEDDERGSRRHKHKKRSKRKHRHRSPESPAKPAEGETLREAETTMDVETELQTKDSLQDTVNSHSSKSLTSQAVESVETELHVPQEEDKKPLTSQAVESVETELHVPQEEDKKPSDSSPAPNLDTCSSLNLKLVPYQDSSTTELEPTEDTTETEPNEGPTQTNTTDVDDEEEALLLDVHVDESIDGLDIELGVASSGVSDQTPETEEEVSPKEEETRNGETDKEEGEISDSETSGVAVTTPLAQPKLSSCVQQPSSQEEDLRVEIERAKRKRELENRQSQSDTTLPAITTTTPTKHSVARKSHKAASKHSVARKNHKAARVEVSCDEYDSSSSSESEDSELERIKRKKAHKAKKLKHKHSSKSRDRDKKEKILKSKKKKEHSRSKKDLRDRKSKKEKAHREERKLKKSEKTKKSKSSSRH